MSQLNMPQLVENQLHTLAEARRDRERADAARLRSAATHEIQTRERFVDVCRREALPVLRVLTSAIERNEPEVSAEVVDSLDLSEPSIGVRLRWLGWHHSSTTLDLRLNRDAAQVTIAGSGLRAREVIDRSLDDLTEEFVRERFTMAASSMLGD